MQLSGSVRCSGLSLQASAHRKALIPRPFFRKNIHLTIISNFYDEDSTIIFSNDNTIDADEFSGYDTIHMYLNEDNLAFNMVKCRIFATRG